jgi:hypothetical protein
VLAHEWALRELTRNLLHNAIKHTPPGGRLAVRLVADVRSAALTVADSGPGIGAEQRQRLFQPFAAAGAAQWLGPGAGDLPRNRDQPARQHRTQQPPARRPHRRPGRRGAPAPAHPHEHEDTDTRTRLDKWLWAARFYKTRALAAGEIGHGRVSVNGQVAKASRELRVGDRVVMRQAGLERTVDRCSA